MQEEVVPLCCRGEEGEQHSFHTLVASGEEGQGDGAQALNSLPS